MSSLSRKSKGFNWVFSSRYKDTIFADNFRIDLLPVVALPLLVHN